MSEKRTKVAVIQMTSGEDVQTNLAVVSRLTAMAVSDGARLVVLPECFAYLGPDAGKFKISEPLPEGGPILKHCSDLARNLEIDLILGGFWEKTSSPSQVANTSVHLNTAGSIAKMYRKIHLFDVDLPDGTKLKESDTVMPGGDPVVTTVAFGTLGMSICYDVRFPELYRKLVDQGAIALTVPAAFTLTTGKDHWHVLLRARAIESQCYVLAAAQTGRHYGTRVSYGHALIVDPWGVVIAECGEGEGVAIGYVEPERVQSVRSALPSLRHRKL